MNRGLKLSFNSQASEIVAPVTTVCKICLQTGKIPIYGDTKHEDVSEDIRIFTGIEMRRTDEFTNHLCERCNQLLWCAKVFRKVALESDKMLISELNQTNTSSDAENEASESALSDNEDNASAKDNIVNEEHLEECDEAMNVGSAKCDDSILFVSKKEVDSNKIRSRSKSTRSAQNSTPKTNDDIVPVCDDDEQLRKLSKIALPTGNEKTVCAICGKSYTVRYIDQHMKIQHDPSSYTLCKICNKKFYTPFYRRHLFITHNVHLPKEEKKRSYCNICKKWFHSNGFKQHVASRHNGPAIKFFCDICNKEFLRRHRYITHMQIHKDSWAAKCKIFPHLMKAEESANEESILNELHGDPQESGSNEQKVAVCSGNPEENHTNEQDSIEYTENLEGNDTIGQDSMEYTENFEGNETIEQNSMEYNEDIEVKVIIEHPEDNSNVLMQEIVIDQISADPENQSQQIFRKNQANFSSENDEKIQCKYCNKMISAKSTYYFRHLFETHDIPLPHTKKGSTAHCGICDKSFQKKSLKRHIATQHDGTYERKHCVQCGRDFYTTTQYNDHLKNCCKGNRTRNLEGFARSLQKKKMTKTPEKKNLIFLCKK